MDRPKKEIAGQEIPSEAKPLTPEGYRRRKFMIVCRALFYGALVVIPLELSRCLENPTDKFLGKWETKNESKKMALWIKDWKPEAGNGPSGEFKDKDGKVILTLVKPVQVEFQGYELVTPGFWGIESEPIKEGRGGIYEMTEGGYAFVAWGLNHDIRFEIEIDNGDLVASCISFKNLGCLDNETGKLSKKIEFGRFKRKE